MSEVHGTQNRGTFGDLKTSHRDSAVLTDSGLVMILVLFLCHDLGVEKQLSLILDLGRIPVLRSLYPGHIYVHGGYARGPWNPWNPTACGYGEMALSRALRRCVKRTRARTSEPDTLTAVNLP